VDHYDLLGLAAQIVSAHMSKNPVSPDQLPKLINDVHHALTAVSQVAAEQPKAEPFVPIKKSVFAGHVVCLDCGRHFSMLKRHLMTDHQMTPDQYRKRWGLPSSYPVVSPNYAETRSALAKKNGLGRGGKAAKKAGRTAAQRKRSDKGCRMDRPDVESNRAFSYSLIPSHLMNHRGD
jgi:predicted transcriptional regulator